MYAKTVDLYKTSQELLESREILRQHGHTFLHDVSEGLTVGFFANDPELFYAEMTVNDPVPQIKEVLFRTLEPIATNCYDVDITLLRFEDTIERMQQIYWASRAACPLSVPVWVMHNDIELPFQCGHLAWNACKIGNMESVYRIANLFSESLAQKTDLNWRKRHVKKETLN